MRKTVRGRQERVAARAVEGGEDQFGGELADALDIVGIHLSGLALGTGRGRISGQCGSCMGRGAWTSLCNPGETRHNGQTGLPSRQSASVAAVMPNGRRRRLSHRRLRIGSPARPLRICRNLQSAARRHPAAPSRRWRGVLITMRRWSHAFRNKWASLAPVRSNRDKPWRGALQYGRRGPAPRRDGSFLVPSLSPRRSRCLAFFFVPIWG